MESAWEPAPQQTAGSGFRIRRERFLGLRRAMLRKAGVLGGRSGSFWDPERGEEDTVGPCSRSDCSEEPSLQIVAPSRMVFQETFKLLGVPGFQLCRLPLFPLLLDLVDLRLAPEKIGLREILLQLLGIEGELGHVIRRDL